MKKIISSLAVISAMLLATSCTNNANVKVVTSADSLSYAVGVLHTEGFSDVVTRMGVDLEYLPEVIEGIKESFKSDSPAEKAKSLGNQLGFQIKNDMIPYMNRNIFFAGEDSLNADILLNAFISALEGKETLMDVPTATAYFRTESEKIRNENMKSKYSENKEKGIAFLEENKAKDGVQVTESGLQYKVVKMGNGKKPSITDKVKVHYHGTLIDGTVFDSSKDRNKPAVFGLTQVIPGWTEGLQLMPVGSEFIFYIPYELAYGDMDRDVIKPYSTLVFEVELLSIEK